MAAALPKVTNYVKNLGKSVAFASANYMKGAAPNAADFMETNADLFKDVYGSIKNYKDSLKAASKSIKDSKLGEAFTEGKKALFEDLKTGQFYNVKRIDQFNERASGESFSDDDWGFGGDDDWGGVSDIDDMDDDDFDDDTGAIVNATVKSNQMVSKKIGTAIDESIKANATVTIKSASYISDSIQKQTGILFSQSEKIFSSMNVGMAGLREEVAKVSTFVPVMQTHVENSRTYYEESLKVFRENNAMLKELTEMQRNLYKAEREPTKRSQYQDTVTSNGMPDIKEYVRYMKKNFKEILPPEFGMLFGNDMGEGNLLLTLVASPLKVIPDLLIKTIVPMTLKKTIETFDESLGGIFGSLMAKLANWANNDSAGGIFTKIGQVLGLKVNSKSSVDTGKYTKGPVPFDGVTKKAITEVIPGYLARIEAALTSSKERIYDYESGRWTDLASIRSEHDKRKKSAYTTPAYDVMTDIDTYLNELRKVNEDAAKNMREQVEGMFKRIYEDYGTFEPYREREKDDGPGSGTEPWEYYGFDDEASFKQVLKLMKKNRGKLMNLGGEMLDSRERLARYYESAEEGLSPIRNLYNNAYDSDGSPTTGGGGLTGIITNASDEYNKNIFFYLRGMYSELVAIRESGGRGGNGKGRRKKNGPGGGGGGNYGSGDPLANLERRLRGDVDNAAYNILTSNSSTSSFSDEDFDLESFNDDYELQQAIKEREAQDSKDDTPFLQKLLQASSLGDKWKVMQDGLGDLMKKPSTIIAGLFDKADKKVFDLIFGSENTKFFRDRDGRNANGMLNYMVLRMQETFDNLSDWMHEHIFDPFMEWFKTTPAYDALQKGKEFIKDKTAPVVDALRDKLGAGKGIFKNAMSNTYGRIFAETSPIFNERARMTREEREEAEYDDYIEMMANGGFGAERGDILNSARGRLVTKRGLTMISPGEMIIPASFNKSVQNRQLREEKRMKNRLFPNLKTQFNAAGTVDQEDLGIDDDPIERLKKSIRDLEFDGDAIRSTTQKVMKEVSPNAPDIIATGLLGGGVSLLTGLIGGPLLGAVAGTGIALVQNSEYLKEKLFGTNMKMDPETGKMYGEGGIIPPKMQVAFKKYFPDMRDFGIAGGVAGLFTPMGVLGGIMVGSTIGFLKNNEGFQNFLFGDKNPTTGERDGGLISKDFRDKVKKSAPRMAMGVVGGALLGPFGLLGNAVLGSALGFATTTDTFHRVVFGEEGPDGKHHGGIVGKLKDFITSVLDFGKEKILKPLKNFIEPFTQMIKNAVTGVADSVKGFLANMFERTIGRPLSDFIEHKVIGGMLKWMKRFLFIPVKLAKGAITAPFAALGWMGNNIRQSQINRGTATNMTAEQRLNWRDQHTVRGVLDPRWDRFNNLDRMLANDFQGADGVDKLREMKDQLELYLEAKKELGPAGAKIVKDVGKDISEFFNLERSRDGSKSLYEFIGYNKIKALHKLVRKGDLAGIDKWLDKRLDYMTVEQKTTIMNKIKDRVLKIADIRRGQRENRDVARDARSGLAAGTGGSLTSDRVIRRFIRNIDTEISHRENMSEAAIENIEDQMDPYQKVINQTIRTKSDAIIELLATINRTLIGNNDTALQAAEAAERVERGELDVDTAIAQLTSDDASEIDRHRTRGLLSRVRTKVKNKIEKFKQNRAGANQTPPSTEVDPSQAAEGGATAEGGLLSGSATDVIRRVNEGFHTVTTEDGHQGVADSMGNLLNTRSASAIEANRIEIDGERRERRSFMQTLKDSLFGRAVKGVGKLLKGAKNGLFGLISTIANNTGIVGKVVKGIVVGGTAIALTGHLSELLKNAWPKIKEFFAPVVEGIKGIGRTIVNGLAEAFPDLFGEDGKVTKIFTKVGDFFTTLIESPGKVWEGIVKWYKDGFTLFKLNILDPLLSDLLPRLGTVIWNAVHKTDWTQFLASIESKDVQQKEYQAVDKEGRKLYKDAEGNITTNAVTGGKRNEAYMTSVAVTTTKYGDDGLPLSSVRNAIAAPGGRTTDYVKEATHPITKNKYTFTICADKGFKGDCVIVCNTTKDYVHFTGYNENTKKYSKIRAGAYTDSKGEAVMTGSIVGAIVGFVAAAALAIGAIGTAGMGIPAALGIAAAVSKGTFAAGGVIGAVAYRLNNGSYLSDFDVNPGSSEYEMLLDFFGIRNLDFDNWPLFSTTKEYEEAVQSGSVEKIEAEALKITMKDVEDFANSSQEDVTSNLMSPALGTKMTFWHGKSQAYYEFQYRPGPMVLNFNWDKLDCSDWIWWRKFYNASGVLAWYDTRCTWSELPIEIKSITDSSTWKPNVSIDMTEYYPTVDENQTAINHNNATKVTGTAPTTTSSSVSSEAQAQSKKQQEDSEKTFFQKIGEGIKNFFSSDDKDLKTRASLGVGRAGKGHIWQKELAIANQRFGNSTMGEAGCGPVTAANMLNTLSGESRVGKGSILDATTDIAKSYVHPSGGTNVEYFRDVFGQAGYSTDETTNKSSIINNIKSGVPGVLLGNSGINNSSAPFGANDHFINVYGVDNHGNAIVEDPDLPSSRVLYPLNKVVKDSKMGTFLNGFRRGRRRSPNRYKSRIGYGGGRYRGMGGTTEIYAVTRRALAIIESFESGGDYGAINANDVGSVSLGKIQWRAGRAANLLRLMIEMNGGENPGFPAHIYNELISGATWGSRPFNSEEKTAVAKVLRSDLGKAAQDKQRLLDVNGYVDIARNFGYTDENAIVYYCDCYNASPNATLRISRQARSAVGGNAANIKLDDIHAKACADGTLGNPSNGHRARRDKLYAAITGSAPVGFGTETIADGDVSSVVASDASQANTLVGQITALGNSILRRLYGDAAVDFVFGTPASPSTGTTTTDGVNVNTTLAGTFAGTDMASSNFTWPEPTGASITSGFGPRNINIPGASKYHRGIDIGIPDNTQVLAAAPGTVSKIDYNDARGKYIRIDHGTVNGETLHTLYQHLSNNSLLKVGDKVKQGQSIALSGQTGIGGSHLHFGVYKNGIQENNAVDPAKYVSRNRKYTGGSRGKTQDHLIRTNSANAKAIRDLNELNYKLNGHKVGYGFGRAVGYAREEGDYSYLLETIVYILTSIATNTSVLNQILAVLSKNGVNIDRTAIQQAAGNARTAKARIREIVNEANRNAGRARAANSAEATTGLLDNESTAYIVQVMEALATQ